MSASLSEQAQRLYEEFADLLRRYQFRDREEVCCFGVSVSQCYAMEALHTQGAMTMGELAEHLCLEISSVTRVVDHLVREGLVRRVRCSQDRRVCRVELTQRGRSLVGRIRAELVTEYQEVLRRIPRESRDAVIAAMGHLRNAFTQREDCSCRAKGKEKRKEVS